MIASIFNETKSVSQKLYNRGAGNSTVIEFVKPCPKVEWAGELKRDRHFVVNANSDDEENISVTIFNPNHSEMNFHSMTSDRLEKVLLYYRQLGKLHWSVGRTDVKINGKLESKEVDYAADYAKESNYGYTTMKWKIANKVPEGSYEIMIETQCVKLGGPDDIDMFNSPVLSGVIDLTPPEQYGETLPLQESVIVGEEITVLFTESLQCDKPFTFEMKVIIEDTEYKFDREELHVVCEGRRIGFQIDPSIGVDVDLIMGKTFSVEIGRIGLGSKSNVYDENGNSLVGNIMFKKKFTKLDMEQSSVKVTITFKAFDNEQICLKSNEAVIKAIIIRNMGMQTSESDRLKISSYKCGRGIFKFGGWVMADVVILSKKGNERMLRERDSVLSHKSDRALDIFYNLRDLSKKSNASDYGRKLTSKRYTDDDDEWILQLSNMRIIPPASDMEMLKLSANLVENQKKRLHLIRTPSVNNYQNNSIDGIINNIVHPLLETQEKQQEIQEEQIHSLQHTQEEQISALTQEMRSMFIITLACMIIMVVVLYHLIKYGTNTDDKKDKMIPPKEDSPF